MKVREVAFKVLWDILRDDLYSNIALDKALRDEPFSIVDKKFLTMLVHGTLQRYSSLEYEIDQVTKGKVIKPKMKLMLIMSLYQLRYMDKTPSYAIINEAVEYMKNLDGKAGASFTNGVLRTLTRENHKPKVSDFPSYLQYLSVAGNTPMFICKMWNAQYGGEITKEIIKVNLKEAPLTIRINTLKTTKEKLLNEEYEEGKLSPCSLIYKGNKRISELEEFKNGEISVQDESGQLVALMLDPKQEDIILDMCAAPGSKTGHIAELMKNKGKIYALDLYEHRIKLLIDGMNRLGVTNVEALAKDATNLDFEKEMFDKVLLDAPCSGLGVVRRKPDILRKITPERIDSIINDQKLLLESANKHLKVGGVLVYSTCTINKNENEKQIAKFIENHPNYQLIEEKVILPYEYNSDGFYIAKLKKGEPHA